MDRPGWLDLLNVPKACTLLLIVRVHTQRHYMRTRFLVRVQCNSSLHASLAWALGFKTRAGRTKIGVYQEEEESSSFRGPQVKASLRRFVATE